MLMDCPMNLLILATCLHSCFALFIQGSSTLPRESDGMAVGYDSNTDTILLFGGPGTQFVTFKDHTFTDRGSNYLSKSTSGWSQQYTQLGNELWFIQNIGTSFTKVNTQTYTASTPSITIPTNVDAYGCLSSIDGYLIVVGGGDPTALKNTQMYSFSSAQWLIDVPPLNTKRKSLSCIVAGDTLYAIGGDDDSTYLDSIETLDISNIDNISTQTWDNTWAKTLISARKATRAVVYGTDIYVIGGKDNSGDRLTDINVIDSLTGTVASGDTLAFRTSYAASIIADNTLYIFAGFGHDADGEQCSSCALDTYQYSTLPTTNPTKNPTPAPSKASNPTSTPSFVPTSAPSSIPTSTPSYVPSALSFVPTSTPSFVPTLAPSSVPTSTPSFIPTFAPSSVPTSTPSSRPTSTPSSTPSGVQTSFTVSPTFAENEGRVSFKDATTTEYIISVEINNCNTGCGIEDDSLNALIEAVLSVDDNVALVNTEIVKDHIVIHLLITTTATGVLEPEVISDYIERKIHDNDAFGDVKAEKVKAEEADDNVNESSPLLSDGQLEMMITGVILVIVCAVLFIGSRMYIAQKRAHAPEQQTMKDTSRAVSVGSVSDVSVDTGGCTADFVMATKPSVSIECIGSREQNPVVMKECNNDEKQDDAEDIHDPVDNVAAASNIVMTTVSTVTTLDAFIGNRGDNSVVRESESDEGDDDVEDMYNPVDNVTAGNDCDNEGTAECFDASTKGKQQTKSFVTADEVGSDHLQE